MAVATATVNPPLPPELKLELDRINTGVGKYIAKAVTFVLTPLLLPLAASFAYWIQKAFGIDLDPTELTGYLVAIASGVGITVYKWVANRGEWEKSVLLLAHWYKIGSEATANQTPPPGLPPA